MKRTASFEYDPADIPKMQDQLQVKFMELQDEAYQKGLVAERERIIKVIEDSFGNMTAEVMIQRIKEGTK
jgi:hypothetical protein